MGSLITIYVEHFGKEDKLQHWPSGRGYYVLREI